MHTAQPPNDAQRFLRGSLLALGTCSLALAALADARVILWIDPDHKLMPETLDEAARSRLEFGVVAVVFGVAAALVVRTRLAAWFLQHRARTRALLFALFFCWPLFALERALAPFNERHTTIFVRDPDLGWKLRPLAHDYWSGTPVKINSHGLRGPEREHAKPKGTTRVLFLGDSVTFGFAVVDDERTLPAQVEDRLTRELARPVECINGGVDGYSSWQELAFLKREGVLYEPDLVVVCFVLNDVDERFRLKRWGGSGEGFQLARTLSDDGFHFIETSSILHFAHRIAGRLRFGHDVQEGARVQQLFDTYDVMFHPERDDVRAAWKQTLADVDAIVVYCRERKLPLLLVVFPYATQLYRPELNSPQLILARFAAERSLPFLDLQPPLLKAVRHGSPAIDELFVDPIHTSAKGDELAAERITAKIIEAKLPPVQ